MLNALNNYDEQEMLSWLREALSRKRALPLTTSDEPPYLGILRLESQLAPHARRAIDKACVELLGDFLATRSGNQSYLTQLIFLASKLKNTQITAILANTALKSNEHPPLDTPVAQIILGVLVDASVPLDEGFWHQIRILNPECFSGFALAGVLRTNPSEAISMLPLMPDIEKIGRVATMNIDLRFDSLAGAAQSDFLKKIALTLPCCSATFAAPLMKWVAAKTKLEAAAARSTSLLAEALQLCMGAAAVARRLTPKLLNVDLEVA